MATQEVEADSIDYPIITVSAMPSGSMITVRINKGNRGYLKIGANISLQAANAEATRPGRVISVSKEDALCRVKMLDLT